MNLRTTLVAAAAAMGLAGAAQAAEPISWTGFYIGAHVGYLWGEVDTPSTFTGELEPEGALLGGQIGYDHQLDNNIVLGAFVAAPFLFADDDDTVGTINFDADLEWAVTFGGRVGYAFGQLLPYVMAGYVIGEGNGEANGPGVNFDLSETHDGYQVGGGLDYLIDENFDAGILIGWTDLSEETYNFTTPADVSFDALFVGVKADFRF
jgi:opacity protein-like surface antigen